MNYKQILFKTVGRSAKCLSIHMPSRLFCISQENANIWLNQHYTRKPLWDSIPRLKPATIDLSLIIPVYNSEKYISKCLDSVFAQQTDYKYEVICINDGSKDSSLQILESYQKTHDNLIVVSQANQGISCTRNRGITISNGRYIGFVDNDDYLDRTYIERILNKAYETDSDIIQVGHYRVTPEGMILASICQDQDLLLTQIDSDDKVNHVSGYIWGGALKRQLFENVRFPEGFWYEDMITRLIMMRSAKRVYCISDCLYYYVVHGTNASKTVWKTKGYKCLDQLILAKELTEYGKDVLGLYYDQTLYKVLLYEFGTVLWLRTRQLGINNQQKVFRLAADYMTKIRPKGIVLTAELDKTYDQAFLTQNFLTWYLYSLGHMCSVKIRNNSL